jgi:hypothetical protein
MDHPCAVVEESRRTEGASSRVKAFPGSHRAAFLLNTQHTDTHPLYVPHVP